MNTNSTETRSEYFGVYHNRKESTQAAVPYRAAIRRGRGDTAKWINLGYTKSEKVAAAIYNLYAVIFFGKGARVNEMTLNEAERQELEDWFKVED